MPSSKRRANVLGKLASVGRGAALPVTLGAVGGIAFGLFHPLVDLGRATDGGVAPYGRPYLFAASILGSTILLAPFFFNFPVAGAPITVQRLSSPALAKQHALGLVGGILAGTAFLTGLLALAAPGNAGGAQLRARARVDPCWQ